jgi:hypothetical protein
MNNNAGKGCLQLLLPGQITDKMNIRVNRSARAFAKEETYIAATPEKVYSILVNVNQWPSWQSEVVSAVMDGAPEVNKTFDWKAGGSRLHSRFHTLTPFSEIGWTGRVFWITAVHNWYLEKEGDGTRVIVEESFGGFLSGMLKSMLEKGMKKSLLELKAIAERV